MPTSALPRPVQSMARRVSSVCRCFVWEKGVPLMFPMPSRSLTYPPLLAVHILGRNSIRALYSIREEPTLPKAMRMGVSPRFITRKYT